MAGSNLAFADQTFIHPIGLAVLLLAVISIIWLPRAKVVLPVLVIIAFMPSAQQIAVLGLDFTFLRIVLFVATARLAFGPNGQPWAVGTADKWIILYAIWGIIAYSILNQSFAALIYYTT